MTEPSDVITGPGGADGPPPRGPFEWSGRAWLAIAAVAAIGAVLITMMVGSKGASPTADNVVSQPRDNAPIADFVTKPRTDIEPIVHPRGTRLVGDGDAMVAVPTTWRRTETKCGAHRAQVLVVSAGGGSSHDSCRQRQASLVIDRRPAAAAVSLHRTMMPNQGNPLMRQSRLVQHANRWRMSLALLHDNATFTVSAPSIRRVKSIALSFRRIPPHYTVVPDLISLDASRAESLLDLSSLVGYRYTDGGSMGPAVFHVVAQRPSAGSVVRVNSTVSLGEVPTAVVPK